MLNEYNIFLFFANEESSYESIVNLMTALATIMAVIVALFQDWIRRWWNKATLDLSLLLEPPDCHQIRMNKSNGNAGLEVIYLRVRVNNISQRKAEKVEIMITKLWRITSEGNELVSSFLPMSLKWSHYGTSDQNIPAQTFKHCDIGPVFPLMDGKAKMKFDVVTQPNEVSGGIFPNIINAGKYQFELITTADNARSSKTLWYLEFDGVWVSNEKAMLADHIKIMKL